METWVIALIILAVVIVLGLIIGIPVAIIVKKKQAEAELMKMSSDSDSGYLEDDPVVQGVLGRKIKLQLPKIGCLNLSDIKVYDVYGNNVVNSGTRVDLSSRFGNDYPGSFLVDGDTNSFAHTSCSDVGSMTIDLGKEVDIRRIVVKNRVDCCWGRSRGTILTVIKSNGTVSYTAQPMTSTNGSKIPLEDSYPPTQDDFKFYTYNLPNTTPIGSNISV